MATTSTYPIHFRVPADTHQALKSRADTERRPLAQLVTIIVVDAMASDVAVQQRRAPVKTRRKAVA